MQGETDRQRELLDVGSVAGHLLESGNVFALLAEHRDRLFPAQLFADMFPSGRGRPSIPGEVVASVNVLQALYGQSDREAGRRVGLRPALEGGVGTRLMRRGSIPPR